MPSIIPILISQKMIREASRSQALLDDDEYCEEMQGSDGDESVDALLGMALFVGLFAVVVACIGWCCCLRPRVGVDVFRLLPPF